MSHPWRQLLGRVPVVRRSSHEELRLLMRERLEAAREETRVARESLTALRREAFDRAHYGGADERTWENLLHRASAELPATPKTRLSYFPTGTTNPYMRMLYGGCPEFGIRAEPVQNLDELVALEPEGRILHLHWTGFLQARCKSRGDASEANRSFLALLDDLRGRGVRLLWTIHEPLPHECPFPEEEAKLRGELTRRAEAIHVLHDSTLDAVGSLFPVPRERTFTVRHPLFTGFYPDHVPRAAARAMLGLADDEVALLTFGSWRPYKGLDRLPALAGRLEDTHGRRIRVVVAGRMGRVAERSPLSELGEDDPRFLCLRESVPDTFVQVLFRAADLAVLPYRDFLNSGALMLALSFGLRTVVSEGPAVRELTRSGLVHLFPADSEEGLADVTAAAIQAGAAPPMPPDVARELAPATTARLFAREVARRFLAAGDGDPD